MRFNPCLSVLFVLIPFSLPAYSQTANQIANDLIQYEASKVKENCFYLKRMNDAGKSAFSAEARMYRVGGMIEKFNMTANQAKNFVAGMDIAVSRLCPNIW